MYFVDRRKIADTLDYIDRLLRLFAGRSWESPVERLALERLCQNLIEAMIDVGNQMIDGFIMRDPGGYEDVIAILHDESVLPDEEAEAARQVVRLRKMLVKDYMNVDYRTVEETIAKNLDLLKTFSERIRTYLEKELGPVSAFSAKTDKK